MLDDEKTVAFPMVKVVGMHYRGAHAKEYVANLEIGFEGLTLERERENEHDVNAVKVMAPGEEPWHLGYIEGTAAAYIAPYMDEGKTFSLRVINKVTEGKRATLYPVVDVLEAKDPRIDAPMNVEGTSTFHHNDQDDGVHD